MFVSHKKDPAMSHAVTHGTSDTHVDNAAKVIPAMAAVHASDCLPVFGTLDQATH